MIPTTNPELQEDLEFEEIPGLGFRMNLRNETIVGLVDEVESIKQAIFMILNTERYDYLIYTWDYGVELKDLYGEPVTYACPEIERRVTEALMMDERIVDVNTFEFDYSKKGIIHVTFVVDTLYGDIQEEMAVNI